MRAGASFELKVKKVAELSDEDCAHTMKVIGYPHRHEAQPPQGDVERTLALLAHEPGH